MLDEDPVLDPEDVCRDPVHGCPEPGEATMHYDEVAVSYDHARFVFQRRRHALDQVEQPLPAGCDVRTVLDVVGRPESFSRFIGA